MSESSRVALRSIARLTERSLSSSYLGPLCSKFARAVTSVKQRRYHILSSDICLFDPLNQRAVSIKRFFNGSAMPTSPVDDMTDLSSVMNLDRYRRRIIRHCRKSKSINRLTTKIHLIQKIDKAILSYPYVDSTTPLVFSPMGLGTLITKRSLSGSHAFASSHQCAKSSSSKSYITELLRRRHFINAPAPVQSAGDSGRRNYSSMSEGVGDQYDHYNSSKTRNKRKKIFRYIMYGGGVLFAMQKYISLTLKNEGLTLAEFIHIGDVCLQSCRSVGQKLISKINNAFDSPSLNEPLLPDLKDLSYPDGLPTLVVNFDKVVAKMEYDPNHGWRLLRRPGANRFFRELMAHYEIVVWSDDPYPVSQDACSKWGLPVIGCLHKEHCSEQQGKLVKDISRLGRQIDRIVIADYNPEAFGNYQANGIVVKPFEGDTSDIELYQLTDFLKYIATYGGDVRTPLALYGGGQDGAAAHRYVEQRAISSDNSNNWRWVGRGLGINSLVGRTFINDSSTSSPLQPTHQRSTLEKIGSK